MHDVADAASTIAAPDAGETLARFYREVGISAVAAALAAIRGEPPAAAEAIATAPAAPWELDAAA